MRTKLLTFLCLLMAMQSALSNAVSGHNLRMLNAQGQQNVLVICTGTSTKWINSEIYFETGEIVQIEQPSDVTDIDMSLACFSSLLFDNNASLDVVAQLSTEIVPVSSLQLPNLIQISALPRAFLLPVSRAPPFISFS